MAQQRESWITNQRKRFGSNWFNDNKQIKPIMNNAENIIFDLVQSRLTQEDLADVARSSVVQNSIFSLINLRLINFRYLRDALCASNMDGHMINDPNYNRLLIVCTNTVTLYEKLYQYLSNWLQTKDYTFIIRITNELCTGMGQNNYGNYLKPSRVL